MTFAKQRNAEDVHATGPAPGPQHTGRSDHVQRDRVRPRGRRVPEQDQAHPARHHRFPVDRVFRVHRKVHGRTAVQTGNTITQHCVRIGNNVFTILLFNNPQWELHQAVFSGLVVYWVRDNLCTF